MNKLEQIIRELNSGKIILVQDDQDRENEFDFVLLAEFANQKNINFMITHGKGLVCVAVSEQRAKELDLNLMIENPSDPLRTAFTVSIDHYTNGTGISASDRAVTIQAIANPNTKKEDFRKPGHIFPVIAKPNGLKLRRGHTEAAVYLAQKLGKEAAVICEVLNSEGIAVNEAEALELAKIFDLKIIKIKDL